MTHITNFTPINFKSKSSFALDNANNFITAEFTNKIDGISNNYELYSNIILSEGSKFASNLELVNFFKDHVLSNIKLLRTKDSNNYYLRYTSKTINLTLHLYEYNDYVEEIENKLSEIVRINDLLQKGNKKIIDGCEDKIADIHKQTNIEKQRICLELDTTVARNIVNVEKLELEIKTLNSRIVNQNVRTEERIKKIKELSEENKKLTSEIDRIGKINKLSKNKSLGTCGICDEDKPLVPVDCCINKCCVSCFCKITKDNKFKCPYCRSETK
jgi:hypothetical protein